MNNPSDLFDANYYQHNCGLPYEGSQEFIDFFNLIARFIVREINPSSVMDAGCAMGYLVEALRNEQVEAYGVDISEYAISRVHANTKPFVKVGSIADPFPRTYDLIVSIEVLEHIPKAEGEKAIANICQSTDDVLFSSTPFDYKEATHFNVQPPEYWSEQFARHGFYRDVDFDARFITTWTARYRRRKEPFHRIILEIERKAWIMTKENQDLRTLVNEMRGQLSTLQTQAAQPDPSTAEIVQLRDEVGRLKEQNLLYEERWADLQRGAMWRLIQKIWSVRLFLAPRGSRREKWLSGLKAKL